MNELWNETKDFVKRRNEQEPFIGVVPFLFLIVVIIVIAALVK